MGSANVRRVLFAALPVVAIAGLTAVLQAVDADLAVAALCFVPIVVASALLGAVPGGISVLGAFLATNYFFTAPRKSFAIDKPEDIIALLVFGLAGAVVSVTVTRVNQLRRRAVAADREARVRLELINRLAAGEDARRVVESASKSIEVLFGLDGCRVVLDEEGRLTMLTTLGVDLLSPEDRSLLDAFVNGLAASVDRVRLGAEARTALDAAEVERARAGFLAAMTHNLRTPLASIGTAASVLLDPGAGLDRAREVELLETVRNEADRLDHLVTKVLMLGRIQSGAVRPELEPVDVEELVQAAARRVRLVGLGRVQLRSSAELPAVVVDQALIEVALVNALENALRYSSPDSMVEVRFSSDGDHVRLAVIDHGPGVPVADRDRVFEPFERGKDVNDAMGSGIGLAITREFVGAHGGRCWLEETPGGGATLMMTLPFEAAPA